jgi:hypothetical protein
MPSPLQKNRFLSLDYLRGFFIVVIIIDHLSRWPSIWIALSGKAMQWVTAAEGFVIISGLLVGYIRGYKNRDEAFSKVAFTLMRRGGLLYLWSIIATIVYTAIIWNIPLQGGSPGIPYPIGDWQQVIIDSVFLQYTNVWVYFLFLYAIFLFVSPLAIWLLRRGAAWLVTSVSLLLFLIGYSNDSEVLQWQILFFVPVVVGFYLNAIMEWWRVLPALRQKRITLTVIGATLVTMILSVITVFYPTVWPQFSAFVEVAFDKDRLSMLRVLMAFLWFAGLFFIFHRFERQIGRFAGWLLRPFGTKSLTAYIIHGSILCFVSFFTIDTDSIVINSIIGACAIMLVWGTLHIPHINRIIPR